jgi:subtilisin family serine protease
MFKYVALLSACIIGQLSTSVVASFIDSKVLESLQVKNNVNIFVSMKEGTSDVINIIENSEFASRDAKLNMLAESLITNARTSQKSVIDFLENSGETDSDFESYWVSNEIYIPAANKELINKLSKLDAVSEIREEKIIDLFPVIVERENIQNKTDKVEWGISIISADKVWADADNGNRGANVIVANIDTGVRGTHESLKDSFLGGTHSWYDPYDKSDFPKDTNGHGTHTMGSICGTKGVGVAPEAKWMACRGCSTSQCTERALTACGQYITCPTDVNGKNKDCTKAPHVVSNSWGGGQGDKWYQKVTDAWNAAGILTVFAMGNSGSRCRTANSPGDYDDVIGVGATTISDGLASFSSVGPTVGGKIKPDISAPGRSVRSAWFNSDTGYKTISGTSMACPHVAGVVALMKSFDSELNFAKAKQALYGGVDTKTLVKTGKNCGGVSEDTWPNNAFGHGRVNALKSITLLATGTVPTPSPGQPGPTPAPTTPPVQCTSGALPFICKPSDKCRFDLSSFKCVPK